MEVTSQGSPLLQGTVSRNAVTLGQDGWVYAGKTAYEGRGPLRMFRQVSLKKPSGYVALPNHRWKEGLKPPVSSIALRM